MALSLGNIIAHPLSDEQLAYNVDVNDILLATIAITIILSFVQKFIVFSLPVHSFLLKQTKLNVCLIQTRYVLHRMYYPM
jgi:hypothetical protein